MSKPMDLEQQVAFLQFVKDAMSLVSEASTSITEAGKTCSVADRDHLAGRLMRADSALGQARDAVTGAIESLTKSSG